MRLGVLALAGLCMLSACAPKQAAVVPSAPAPPAGPGPFERLAAADRSLRAGCLDCLIDAFNGFDALRQSPEVAMAAATGAIQAGALAALRERGLGMIDTGHLARARAIAGSDVDLAASFSPLLDIVETTAFRHGRIVVGDLSVEGARQKIVLQNRIRWMEMLRAGADDDLLHATLWVSFACNNGQTNEARTTAALLAPLTKHGGEPLVRFEAATCGTADGAAVAALFAQEPRLREAEYWLGFRELRTDLDLAYEMFSRAYEWHSEWPTAALALGGLYMTAEEIPAALEYYERSLTLLPGLGDAMVGRVRAISYLGRHEEAIARANEFLEGLPAEAYYWRAWNRNQLGEIDVAWSDIQKAETLWQNSEVAKLAGVIAYRRQQLDIARDRFQKAAKLNPDDCESHFYLGTVEAELKGWAPSAAAYLLAGSCLDRTRVDLRNEIARIEVSRATPERKARLIENRHQKIATADRMSRQSWFNIAAAYFNLGRTEEARTYAEKVASDDQFAERVKAILGPRPDP